MSTHWTGWLIVLVPTACGLHGAINGSVGAANVFTLLVWFGTFVGCAAALTCKYPVRAPIEEWSFDRQLAWTLGLANDLIAAWAGWWPTAVVGLLGSMLSLTYDFRAEGTPRGQEERPAA